MARSLFRNRRAEKRNNNNNNSSAEKLGFTPDYIDFEKVKEAEVMFCNKPYNLAQSEVGDDKYLTFNVLGIYELEDGEETFGESIIIHKFFTKDDKITQKLCPNTDGAYTCQLCKSNFDLAEACAKDSGNGDYDFKHSQYQSERKKHPYLVTQNRLLVYISLDGCEDNNVYLIDSSDNRGLGEMFETLSKTCFDPKNPDDTTKFFTKLKEKAVRIIFEKTVYDYKGKTGINYIPKSITFEDRESELPEKELPELTTYLVNTTSDELMELSDLEEFPLVYPEGFEPKELKEAEVVIPEKSKLEVVGRKKVEKPADKCPEGMEFGESYSDSQKCFGCKLEADCKQKQEEDSLPE